jgi:glycosyltransferase involved in cell wall biosynthesis
VGKLIGSKGVELLLAAWPRIRAREPRARLLIVGFGAFRQGLEALAAALDAGDLDAARAIRTENGAELPHLAGYLSAADDTYLDAARGMSADIAWAGRLEHGELTDVLPVAEAMIVPSTFPEAFGMVAAEGAAAGALPVVARHSGLAEVARTLAAAVPEPARGWLTFEVGPGAPDEIAQAVGDWLAAREDLRAQTREGMVAATRERYSWDGVARTVIAAARGELEDLPEP